jgi:hypothetical protein
MLLKKSFLKKSNFIKKGFIKIWIHWQQTIKFDCNRGKTFNKINQNILSLLFSPITLFSSKIIAQLLPKMNLYKNAKKQNNPF